MGVWGRRGGRWRRVGLCREGIELFDGRGSSIKYSPAQGLLT